MSALAPAGAEASTLAASLCRSHADYRAGIEVTALAAGHTPDRAREIAASVTAALIRREEAESKLIMTLSAMDERTRKDALGDLRGWSRAESGMPDKHWYSQRLIERDLWGWAMLWPDRRAVVLTMFEPASLPLAAE